ncbi:hypothetical protein [Streptomyces sp. NPDC003006]
MFPVGQRVQPVGVLIEAALRDARHGGPAEAQHFGHQTLVLPQLLGGGVLAPVVRSVVGGGRTRSGEPVQQIRMDGEREQHRHGGEEQDRPGEEPGLSRSW